MERSRNLEQFGNIVGPGIRIFLKKGTNQIGIQPIQEESSVNSEEQLRKVKFFADYLEFLRANGLKDTSTDQQLDYIEIANIYTDNKGNLKMTKNQNIPANVSEGVDKVFKSLLEKFKREKLFNELAQYISFVLILPFLFAINTGKDLSKFGIFFNEIIRLIFTLQEAEDIEIQMYLKKFGINSASEILMHPLILTYLIPFLMIRTKKYGLISYKNDGYDLINDLGVNTSSHTDTDNLIHSDHTINRHIES